MIFWEEDNPSLLFYQSDTLSVLLYTLHEGAMPHQGIHLMRCFRHQATGLAFLVFLVCLVDPFLTFEPLHEGA